MADSVSLAAHRDSRAAQTTGADFISAPQVVDTYPLLAATKEMLATALHRAPVLQRMEEGTLVFAGRAAYLEQHWSGLKILVSALGQYVSSHPGDATPALAQLRNTLGNHAYHLGTALDRAHATPRWREHHVTMPSMLQFRRRINELVASGDVVGLIAHAAVRLAAARACPFHINDDVDLVGAAGAGAGADGDVKLTGSSATDIDRSRNAAERFVTSDELAEYFAEELSAATIMVLAHGSDVCRSYPVEDDSMTCALTVAAIRRALH